MRLVRNLHKLFSSRVGTPPPVYAGKPPRPIPKAPSMLELADTAQAMTIHFDSWHWEAPLSRFVEYSVAELARFRRMGHGGEVTRRQSVSGHVVCMEAYAASPTTMEVTCRFVEFPTCHSPQEVTV